MRKLLQRDQVKPYVIVLGRDRLTEDEIEKALIGNSGAEWYKAIVSKIDQMRDDNMMEASRNASANNPLAMAGAVNAYETLTALLQTLDMYATKTKEA